MTSAFILSIFTMALCFSQTGFAAFPSVGNQAHYSCKKQFPYNGKVYTLPGFIDYQILNLNEFEHYGVEVHTYPNGSVIADDGLSLHWSDKKSVVYSKRGEDPIFFTDSEIKMLLAQSCKDSSNIPLGVPEKITIPAGTYSTCKLPLQNGNYLWASNVPFNLVKIETNSILCVLMKAL